MQEILTFIHSQGDPKPAKTIPNWVRSPWLEHIYFEKTLQETSGPRLLTTHLPYPVLASALKKGQPKVIYLARHPKDVVVSYYHFCRMAKFFPDPGSFDEFLQSFLDGTVHYGSWFDHVKGWLSCRGELSISYLTYEELHQDLEGSVERLCTFLGCPMKPDLMDSIRKNCSFASMSQNDMVNGALVPQEIMDTSKSQFMRKAPRHLRIPHTSQWLSGSGEALQVGRAAVLSEAPKAPGRRDDAGTTWEEAWAPPFAISFHRSGADGGQAIGPLLRLGFVAGVAQRPPDLLEFSPEVPVDPEVDKAVEEAAADGEPQGYEFDPFVDSFAGESWEWDGRRA
ncbi:hypothetical protein JD844_000662 [Phrynosoma platyrhinos]|uniref:Sulfotransferase n=1 Tax=Phrynosoma platyrhinos TaxID=52577 RepID=A0ABQ7SQX4_PHRPL|nr:hypothetical protein JD844_000662 [Phrynosoma platyrhinos]